MKAVRIHDYHKDPSLDQVPEPEVTGPFDVIVRVGGAGLCRTDLHVIDGWFAGIVAVDLPFVLGHETAGWVHAVGSAVDHVAVGDTVICHPQISCGVCRACRGGHDMHCVTGLNFPGVTRDGGFAELLKTGARAVLKLPPGTDPAAVAALADAGLAAYHAVRKAVPVLDAGARVAVIGSGGLGHIGIQCLTALTPAQLIAVDRSPDALALAEQSGAHRTVAADGAQVERVLELSDGAGVDAVIDFVGEDDTIGDALQMLRPGGSYFVVGYGGTLQIPTLQLVLGEVTVVGNAVGSYGDLAGLMDLTADGRISVHSTRYPIDAFGDALADLDQGRIRGRAILVP